MQLVTLEKTNFMSVETKMISIDESKIKSVVQYIYSNDVAGKLAKAEKFRTSHTSFFEKGSNEAEVYLKDGGLFYIYIDDNLIKNELKDLYMVINI